MNTIPEPTIKRLNEIEQLLTGAEQSGQNLTSSTKLARQLGVGAHTIRKDINYLGGIGDTGAGYQVKKLRTIIRKQLGLDIPINGCVIGLGRLGSLILEIIPSLNPNIHLEAAFDSNINKVETFKTDIPLFPAYELEEILKRFNISLAILAIPPEEVRKTVDLLIKNKVQAILNYTNYILPKKPAENVYVKNININQELKTLLSLINTSNQ